MNKYLKLGKVSISIPVALTGFLGYFLARPAFDLNALYTVLGIFLLSSGSSALNQIQERRTDAKMKRTAHRPLPSGQITLQGAILFSETMEQHTYHMRPIFVNYDAFFHQACGQETDFTSGQRCF